MRSVGTALGKPDPVLMDALAEDEAQAGVLTDRWTADRAEAAAIERMNSGVR